MDEVLEEDGESGADTMTPHRTTHLRTIQEETDPLQEKSASAVSREKVDHIYRSLPDSDGRPHTSLDHELANVEQSPLGRH